METGNGMSVADVAALSNGNNHLGGFEGLIYLAVIASMFGGNGWFGNNNDNNDATEAFLAATLANNNSSPAIGYENLATSNEIQRGFDNQNSMANQRDILAAVNNASAMGIAATNQTFHDTVNALSDKYMELQRDIAANAVGIQQVMANQNACCCDTKQLIQGVAANTDAKIAESKYDTALGIAGVNANLAQNKYEAALNTATLDKSISQNRYEGALNTASINETVTAQTQKVLDALAQSKIESLQAQINSLELQNAVAGVVRYPMATSYALPSPCFNAGGCNCGM